MYDTSVEIEQCFPKSDGFPLGSELGVRELKQFRNRKQSLIQRVGYSLFTYIEDRFPGIYMSLIRKGSGKAT